MSRKGYEFNNLTKEAAKLKWHKENPNNEDATLEVDHIISIWFAKKYGLPKHTIKSAKNAKALTHEEHKKKHDNEPTEEEYATLAQALLGYVRRLF